MTLFENKKFDSVGNETLFDSVILFYVKNSDVVESHINCKYIYRPHYIWVLK